MTTQLQQAIQIAESLSLPEQIELLKRLATLIQQQHDQPEADSTKSDTDFSAESFRLSWKQAITGNTLPLSQLWEDVDVG